MSEGFKTINVSCVTYASTFDRGYPAKLSDLGYINCGGSAPVHAGVQDTPKCAGLVDDFLASGRSEGYVYTYAATVPCHGVIEHYTLTATPAAWDSQHDRAFFTDNSGVIHFTTSYREATSSDPPLLDAGQ